ncbi:HAD family hydrolase [Paraburkholderia bannensis]|uniref:HAD family hydrolase n=1 Tax=Paraburkholderia bannensis TaxID=765414 RepID=UPI002ABDE031|nr:HAD family phosphatase [Paraburkholderia bannensis]
MANAAIQALICDCDGVLIDSEAVAASVLVRELEARWPGAVVAPVLMPLLGQRIERVLGGTSEALGRSLSAADVDAIRTVAEREAAEAPLFAGVVEALDAIALTKACASNSYTAVVRRVLERTGLVRFFGDRIYCADSVAKPKPAPDVYLAAAQGLGVAPQACIVVEDSVTGVSAARAAGMRVLGFVGGAHVGGAHVGGDAHAHELREVGAQTIFDDMRMLPGLVADWMQKAEASAP